MNVLSPASAGWDIPSRRSRRAPSTLAALLSRMDLLPQLQPLTAIGTPILTLWAANPLLCQWWVAGESLGLAQGPARVQGVVLEGKGKVEELSFAY